MENYDKVYELIFSGQLEKAKKICEDDLRKLPKSEFTCILNLSLTHLTDDLIAFLDSNFLNDAKLKKTKAFYTEMNCFSINYDKWYLQVSAYDKIESFHSESDWLCEEFWGSYSPEYFTIKGFESLQKAYQKYDNDEEDPERYIEESSEITEYLITIKLQELFLDVIGKGRILKKGWAMIPWGVTSHDSELLLEIK
jgi:hypothetical protein